MAKITSLVGPMTGKMGGSVFSVRGGEQLVRIHQPNVFNPNTVAQVEARAKLKFLSQLGTVLAPYIAIPSRGAVSSRNLFVKANYSKVTYENNEASQYMPSINLTNSVVAFPLISASRSGDTISVSLQEDIRGSYSRAVYILLETEADKKVRSITSVVVNEAGTSGTFPASFTAAGLSTGSGYTVLAYGVRDNTEAARVRFGNLEADSADQVAKLIVTRVLTNADITVSETRGAFVNAAT